MSDDLIEESVDIDPGISATATFERQQNGRFVITGLRLDGSPERPVTAAALRAVHIARLEARANGMSATASLPPLSRPDGREPQEFYNLVSAHYRRYAAISPKPAKLIADAAGVPVTTVHRWIREARLRGSLPPAQRGKAG